MDNRHTPEPCAVANDLDSLREQVAHAMSACCAKYPSDARIPLGPNIDAGVLDKIAGELRAFGRLYKVDIEEGIAYLIVR